MKKTKLKFAAAVAALAMTFALFTGCNPGEDATSGDTTGNTSSGTETTTQTPTESGDGEEEKETVVDAVPSTTLDKVKASYNFAYIFQVQGDTNYFGYALETEKNISFYDTLAIKLALFDATGNEITNEYGKLNIKAQDANGNDLADFGWNNGLKGGAVTDYLSVSLAEGATDAPVKQLLFCIGTDVTYVGIISADLNEKDTSVLATLNFAGSKGQWGYLGSTQINLDEKITVSAGESYTVKVKAEIGSTNTGIIRQLYIQDTKSWKNIFEVANWDEGLAESTITEEYTWTVLSEQAGEHEKVQFGLSWNSAEADEKPEEFSAECVVKLVEFSITKNQ